MDVSTSLLRFGAAQLDIERRRLLIDGQPAALGARAFDLLLALVERSDRAVNKNELLDLVWPGLVVEENNLQVHISALRKLLGPQAITTIPGKGYKFTAALDEVEPAAGHVRTPQATPNNLPPQRTRFIGRETALVECARLMQDTRLLTLTGVGGCGKTRLALQLAQQQLAQFPGGAWFVDLAPLQDAERVVSAVAAALGVQEDAGAPLIDRLVVRLAAHRVLLVLDNCEHVIDAVVDLIDSLLAGCGFLQVLATSREALGVSGEQLFPVRSLSLPAASDLEAIQGSEAVRVFVDRARLTLPHFEVNPGNAVGITEICRRLDGIALAIELAAARVKILSVDEIRARLADRFRLLTGGSRALPRHQTLQAAMHWSYEHLSPQEQRLLRQLAVFAGGWTLAAATQVIGGADEYEVLELLTALHDKSLIVAERESQGQHRYRMLETVRHYAQERLDESGEGEEARTRHLLHFLALAEEAEPQFRGPQQGEVLARLGLEQENLLTSWGWCDHAPGGAAYRLRLAGNLWRYWSNSSQLMRGYDLTLEAVERTRSSTNELARCLGLLALGQLAFRIGRSDETIACATEALSLARATASTSQTAMALSLLGGGLRASGQTQLAKARYEQSLELARAAGDRYQLATALNNIAEVHRSIGELAAAESHYEQAIDIGRETGNAGITAIISCNLARVHLMSGNEQSARQHLLKGLAAAEAAGLRGMSSHLLEVGAGVAYALGEHPVAARLHGASLARLRDSGYRREPVDAGFIESRIASARDAMGVKAYDVAESAGQALGYEESMAELKRWLERSAEGLLVGPA